MNQTAKTKPAPYTTAKTKKSPTPARALVPAPQPLAIAQPSMTDQLITLAVNQNLDIEKLERLMQMKAQEEEKTALAAFNVAMAAVQAKIEPIVADADNDQTDSRYAKLATIVRTLSPIYAASGFSVSFGTCACDSPRLVEAGWFRTTAELSHVAGYAKHYFVDLPADNVGAKGTVNKTMIHGVKSAITYARGILMGLMFNFTTSLDSDTDGNMPADKITREQWAILRDHLSKFNDAAGAERDLCAWLKIDTLENMPAAMLQKAQKAIIEQAKNEGVK